MNKNSGFLKRFGKSTARVVGAGVLAVVLAGCGMLGDLISPPLGHGVWVDDEVAYSYCGFSGVGVVNVSALPSIEDQTLFRVSLILPNVVEGGEGSSNTFEATGTSPISWLADGGTRISLTATRDQAWGEVALSPDCERVEGDEAQLTVEFLADKQ